MDTNRLTTSYLTRQEIRRRPWQFLLSALAVAAGVATVVGSLAALRAERQHAERLLGDQERELDQRFADYQKGLAESMTKAGFQVVILPRDQDMSDWYSQDFAAKSLPPDVLERLGSAPLSTLEHLLPRLVGRFSWPERRWTVIVTGTAPSPLHPSALGTRWLESSVPTGEVDVGSELARAFSLAPGMDLPVGGQAYRVRQCRAATGTKDDISLHFALADAQRVLDRPGQINELLALELPAAWADPASIRGELAERLPEAQAIEIGNRVVATVRARRMAEEESRALLAQERDRQDSLLRSHTRLVAAVAAGAIALSALWLAVMTIVNLGGRQAEIGLLAALGLSPTQVRAVFLRRVLLATGLGLVVGTLPWWGRSAPLWALAALATALPALLAAGAVAHWHIVRHDPAEVLKNES